MKCKNLNHPIKRIVVVLTILTLTQLSFAHPGLPDSTFGQNGFVYMSILPVGSAKAYCSAIQADGKIVLGGYASGVSSNSMAFARYYPDGSPDYSFGIGGISILSLSGLAQIKAIAIQDDGKIIGAGMIYGGVDLDFLLMRINSDGMADSSFGTFGIVVNVMETSDEIISSLAIQPDGKIVAAGYTDESGSKDFMLIRYDQSGNPDISFGTDGIVTTGAAEDEEAYAVALQADGKIVAAGYTRQLGTEDFVVARYNTDGSPDNTFSGDGIAGIAGPWIDAAMAVLIQEDGKIVAAGFTDDPASDNCQFALARFTPAGNLDPDFGTGGIQLTDIGVESRINDICLQPDGKIIAVGYSDDPSTSYFSFTVARYDIYGQLDPEFDTDGVATADFYSQSIAYSVNVRENIIVAAGIAWEDASPYSRFAMAQFNSDGQIVNDFGRDGFVLTAMGYSKNLANDILVLGDGNILTMGSCFNGLDDDGFILRSNPDGSPDMTFGYHGMLIVGGDMNEGIRAATIRSSSGIDDRIYVLGEQSVGVNTQLGVLGLNMDGSFDPGFAGGSPVLISVTGIDEATGIGLMNDGNIILSGYTRGGTDEDVLLVSLTPSGDFNIDFGIDGIVTTDIGLDDAIFDMKIQNDGKILVAGLSSNGSGNDCMVLRYNPDGSLDNSFNGNGIVITSVCDGSDMITAIAVQNDGKIVAAGISENSSGDDLALIRYNSDGSPDESFGSGGIVIFNSDGLANLCILSLQIQANGKLLCTGSADKDAGVPSMITIRFNTDGSVDATYGSDGYTISGSGYYPVYASASCIQEDEKIIAAGVISNIVSHDAIVLLRYNAGDPVNVSVTTQKDKFFSGLLEQNIPNPFSVSTTIRYNIAEAGLVSLKLYDISGNEICTLVHEEKSPGTYNITLNGPDLQKGIYFYQLKTGDYQETKKLICIR